jgi:hypothetical protein
MSPFASPASSETLAAARLTERSLLVSLSIREWTGRRRDREVTARVALDHGAGKKALVPKRFLADIAQVRTEARTLHHKLTLPWFDEGLRILPVDLHLAYMERFRDLRARFDRAVSAFLGAYDAAKAAARVELGSLFRDADYPSSVRLRKAFDFEVNPQPLPTGHDWRIDLPEDTVRKIRLELEARLEEAHRLGLADLYRRLSAVVSRMATTLAQPDKIFRDSLVKNVKDLCQLLPALNVAGDSDLASLASDIERRLASLNPDDLRSSPAGRQAAAVDASALLDSITARLASYTGGAV